MKEIQNNQEIPIPEGLEQRLSALVDRLEAEENERKAATLPHRGREARQRGAGLRVAGKAVLAIAAAFVAFAFLVIVPQVRARQELARYEGSYTVVDGRRIDDLGRIQTDIREALAVAQLAEASVPSSDFASEAERAILQAADNPDMQAVLQRMLKNEE